MKPILVLRSTRLASGQEILKPAERTWACPFNPVVLAQPALGQGLEQRTQIFFVGSSAALTPA